MREEGVLLHRLGRNAEAAEALRAYLPQEPSHYFASQVHLKPFIDLLQRRRTCRGPPQSAHQLLGCRRKTKRCYVDGILSLQGGAITACYTRWWCFMSVTACDSGVMGGEAVPMGRDMRCTLQARAVLQRIMLAGPDGCPSPHLCACCRQLQQIF